jgi:SCP-2 sterol transfer family protein
VAEFLSESWFVALAASLQGLPDTALGAGAPGTGLALGQIVTGVPKGARAADVKDGEVRYTIVLRQGGPATLVRSSTEPAEVTLVADWPTAEAIASGRSSVTKMLSAGRLKLRGDTRALVKAGELLAAVAPLIVEALASR